MKKLFLLYLPAGVFVLELFGMLLLLAPLRSAGMDRESLVALENGDDGEVDGDDDDDNAFLDTICLEESRVNPSLATCDNAEDRDGNACSYCVVGGCNGDDDGDDAAAVSFGLCLTKEQAAIVSNDYGMDCRNTGARSGAPDAGDSGLLFPDDLIGCLEHYQEGDCRQSACIWCNTQVGMGFCVTEAVADTTKSCPFFDCEFGTAASATQ
jgi:hypothetical protein